MNIGILGYGRMGKMIESVSVSRKNNVSEIVDNEKDFSGNADVFIDFTLPHVVMANIEKCCDKKVPMVIGTTGWLEHLQEVDKKAKESGIPIIYGGNFSLGVNLFWRALAKVSKEFSAFSGEYDVFTHEFHHRKKMDSPSGTAITTAQVILDNFPAKKKIQDQCLIDRSIEPDELHVTATRGGSIIGTHSTYFDSDFDTVELTHQARTREGFAYGAVLAAENIQKLKPGLHHFPDIFEELFTKEK